MTNATTCAHPALKVCPLGCGWWCRACGSLSSDQGGRWLAPGGVAASTVQSLGHNSTEAGAPAGSPHLNASSPEQLPGSAATAERADHSGRATVTHISHIADEGLASVRRRLRLFPLFPSADVDGFLREELRRAAERGYALGGTDARHAAPTRELEVTQAALRRAVGVVNDIEKHAPEMRAVLDDFAKAPR